MFWGKIKEVKSVVRELEIVSIRIPDGRARRVRDDDKLRALADSIREHGIIEPILVRRDSEASKPDNRGDNRGGNGKSGESYVLVAGERRIAAAEMMGFVTVPAVIIEADEESGAILAIIENLHREDLTIFEEATAIKTLLALTGMTQELCAARLSVSQSYVANKIRLLRLSEEERELILSNNLTERHARALLRLDGEERREALGKIISREMNVSQAEEFVEELVCAGERRAEKERLEREAARDSSDKRKAEQHRKLIVRDIRMFYNSIDKAVDIIKKSGIVVTSSRRELPEGVVIEIILPKGEASAREERREKREESYLEGGVRL